MPIWWAPTLTAPRQMLNLMSLILDTTRSPIPTPKWSRTCLLLPIFMSYCSAFISPRWRKAPDSDKLLCFEAFIYNFIPDTYHPTATQYTQHLPLPCSFLIVTLQGHDHDVLFFSLFFEWRSSFYGELYLLVAAKWEPFL